MFLDSLNLNNKQMIRVPTLESLHLGQAKPSRESQLRLHKLKKVFIRVMAKLYYKKILLAKLQEPLYCCPRQKLQKFAFKDCHDINWEHGILIGGKRTAFSTLKPIVCSSLPFGLSSWITSSFCSDHVGFQILCCSSKIPLYMTVILKPNIHAAMKIHAMMVLKPNIHAAMKIHAKLNEETNHKATATSPEWQLYAAMKTHAVKSNIHATLTALQKLNEEKHLKATATIPTQNGSFVD
ncbi:hypothetical protein DKX38_018185 [Salix brachista]|uniref:Uncharacterized protein n=1 Tax=Salix brachista TaxID=2182728 RepID=A0A5N5KMC8_9ROSI|nr:hypothetical protein DKX38_018185 [Salix brachista]